MSGSQHIRGGTRSSSVRIYWLVRPTEGGQNAPQNQAHHKQLVEQVDAGAAVDQHDVLCQW
jgi:hypothetical protein